MKTVLRIAISVIFVLYAAAAAAQHGGPRAGRWEFTLSPLYVDSQSVSGSNGSRASIDSDWGFGLGLAYNFNNHFALGGELTWNDAGYRATVVPGPGNPGTPFNLAGTMETSTLRMNGTWHLLAGNFTPFVTGGIGATWVSPMGRPSAGWTPGGGPIATPPRGPIPISATTPAPACGGTSTGAPS